MKRVSLVLACLGLVSCATPNEGAPPVTAAAPVATAASSQPASCPAPTQTLYVPPRPQPGFVPAPAGGARVVAPRRLLAALPVWPSASRDCDERGTVTVSYCVSADGEVENAQVLVSSGYARLDNAVLAWVSRDRHTAGTVNGRPRRYCGMVAEQSREAQAATDRPVAL